MKAIRITRLQATTTIVLAAIAGVLSPMVQRGLAMFLQQRSAVDGPALVPNVSTGFELVAIVTLGFFMLAWACCVSANRQIERGYPAWQGSLLLMMPFVVGALAFVAATRIWLSGANVVIDADHPTDLPLLRNSGLASVAAIETFWLSAGVLGLLMLLFFALLPVRTAPKGKGKTA